jgi:hypothetical protein
VYGFNPRAPIDLLPLPPSETTCFDASQWSEFIFKMHETTKLNIEKMNEKYRIAASKGRKEVKFEPSDLLWLYLRKERFLELKKSKLMSRAAGPFKILAKINDNDLSCLEFRVSPSFNISYLRSYLGRRRWDDVEDVINSRGGGWWGHQYFGYNHSFRWDTWPHHTITSTIIKSSGKLVLMLLRL